MKTASISVSEIANLPNYLIGTLLNIPESDVAALKSSISINAMKKLNARLDSYSK